MNRNKTKICPFCGNEILFYAQKCKFCGEWLDKETPMQATKASNNSETLTKTKLCPYCRQEIPSDAKKCMSCGEWIRERPQEDNTVYKYGKLVIYIIIAIIGLLIECLAQGSGFGILCTLIGGVCLEIYLLPSTIANYRKHRKTTLIFIINFFFGGTVIGWVASLIWALTDEYY